MEKTEYDFNAVSAGQFATPLDSIMEFLRTKAVNQGTSESQPLTSGGAISASVLLIPITDVQTAIQEAHKVGVQEGKEEEANYQNLSERDIDSELKAAFEEGFEQGFTQGCEEGYEDGVEAGAKAERQAND